MGERKLTDEEAAELQNRIAWESDQKKCGKFGEILGAVFPAELKDDKANVKKVVGRLSQTILDRYNSLRLAVIFQHIPKEAFAPSDSIPKELLLKQSFISGVMGGIRPAPTA